MDEQTEDTEGENEKRRPASAPTGAPLVTARLILRQPRMGDAADVMRLANNRKIAVQTRRLPHPYGQADAEAWIAAAGAPADPREMNLLVTRRSDCAVLGAAGLSVLDADTVEIGYWLGEAHWGNGFATEAAQAVIDHAFAVLPLERIHGHCRVANVASRRVLENCGFQYVGTGMCGSRMLRGPVPSEEFVLQRSVWASLKRWGAA